MLFSNPSIWDSKVVVFARDVVEFMLPPTVHIDESWCNLIVRTVVLE